MFKKPNTVPTPDEFFDIAVKERSGSEVKLLATVINKTFRWGKLWDFISISQFEEATGLSNRSIIDGLRSLEKDGWVQSAYICNHCNSIVDKSFLRAIGKDWTKVKNVKCPTCNTNEPPNKWHAAWIEGEDLIEHLRGVYKQAKSSFNDSVPAGVMKKVHEGHEVFTGGVMKKVHEQETSLQETIIQETTTNPPIREKDAQIGISDGGDFINGVQNNSGGDVNDRVHTNSSSDSDIRDIPGVESETDKIGQEQLVYIQGIVDYFNGLKAKHPTKISQRTTRPAKLSTVLKYAKGKYRAPLHWHTEGIPLDKMCEALDTWVNAHTGAPVPLNYFANYDVPQSASELDPEGEAWAKQFLYGEEE